MNFDSAQVMRQVLQAGRYDALQTQAFTPHQVNKAAVESGQAMGFNLQTLEDPMQELQDSMEELSFQFEEKEMKTAGSRKMGERNSLRSAYLTAVEGWNKVMPDMPGGEYMERMRRQLRNMQQGGRLPDSDGLLKMLGEGSKDSAHQFAMLSVLEQSLGSGDEELRALLAKTKAELLATKGDEIKAAINLANEINQTASDTSEIGELRALYRNEVLGFTSPQACFRSLLAARGAGRLAESIDFLVRSCGIDLSSPEPSRVPEELRRIMLDLQCVNVLTAMVDKLGILAGRMSTQFAEACLLSVEQMTGGILDLTEQQFVNSGHIASFITSCGIQQNLAQLCFCTELLNIFRGLSSRLFASEKDRQNLIDAGQEHLDGLVMNEAEDDARRQKGETAA
ncbi:MAG: type III secretion system gatekeeper subunit SctW [Kiritimatiellae bacterium]|nr:type III secretion system gatekeeper subunit SctW [Kiritimatiellia bacterium]